MGSSWWRMVGQCSSSPSPWASPAAGRPRDAESPVSGAVATPGPAGCAMPACLLACLPACLPACGRVHPTHRPAVQLCAWACGWSGGACAGCRAAHPWIARPPARASCRRWKAPSGEAEGPIRRGWAAACHCCWRWAAHPGLYRGTPIGSWRRSPGLRQLEAARQARAAALDSAQTCCSVCGRLNIHKEGRACTERHEGPACSAQHACHTSTSLGWPQWGAGLAALLSLCL